MKITIKVTKEILTKSAFCVSGKDETLTHCAIALAVREIFPNAKVQLQHLYAFGNDTRLATYNGIATGLKVPNVSSKECINLPAEARVFIENFDSSYPEDRIKMPELSFEIDVPSEVIDEIGIGQVYKVLSESRTLELVKI